MGDIQFYHSLKISQEVWEKIKKMSSLFDEHPGYVVETMIDDLFRNATKKSILRILLILKKYQKDDL